MMKVGELIQSADWKAEKHTPVIEAPAAVKPGEAFEIKVMVGKEIAHPNTTEHHIRWIQVFFKPDDDKFCYQLANAEFTAHGEAVAGANQGPAFTDPVVLVKAKLAKPGTILALSYCNIHGLWENAQPIRVA